MIGGNTEAIIQIIESYENEIGENVSCFKDALSPFFGWLDLSSGDSKSYNFKTKIQESTHIFICDYVPLFYQVKDATDIKLTPENSRIVINGETYEVLLYDNSMNMNEQLEIYLKFIGGQ